MRLSGILATFFGLGFAPAMPGTVASAAAAVLYALVLHDLSRPLYVLLVFALFFLGTAVSSRYAAELRRPDPGRIVIDEVCGQLLALAFLPSAWPAWPCPSRSSAFLISSNLGRSGSSRGSRRLGHHGRRRRRRSGRGPSGPPDPASRLRPGGP